MVETVVDTSTKRPELTTVTRPKPLHASMQVVFRGAKGIPVHGNGPWVMLVTQVPVDARTLEIEE